MSPVDSTSLLPGAEIDVKGEGKDAPSYKGKIVDTIQGSQGQLVILDSGQFVPRGDLITLLEAQPETTTPKPRRSRVSKNTPAKADTKGE